jgi:glycosyltransferase involved in cell wall biosynthesis
MRSNISVVIPSFNHADYLPEAIESVLCQSLKPMEVIVVDDGSSDNSVAVASKYGDLIKLIKHPANLGGSSALNSGILASQGNLISILNSDDYWDDNKLEEQFNFMESRELDVAFTRAKVVDKNGGVVKDRPDYLRVFDIHKPKYNNVFINLFLEGNFICHPSAMIKRELFMKYGLYDNRLRQLPDYFQWLKLSTQNRIEIMEERLVNFRWEKNHNTSDPGDTKVDFRVKNELMFIFVMLRDFITEENLKETGKLINLSTRPGVDGYVSLLLDHPNPSMQKSAEMAAVMILFSENESRESDLILHDLLGQYGVEKKDFTSIQKKLISLEGLIRKFHV